MFLTFPSITWIKINFFSGVPTILQKNDKLLHFHKYGSSSFFVPGIEGNIEIKIKNQWICHMIYWKICWQWNNRWYAFRLRKRLEMFQNMNSLTHIWDIFPLFQSVAKLGQVFRAKSVLHHRKSMELLSFHYNRVHCKVMINNSLITDRKHLTAVIFPV